jgi:hypothetical protein
MVVWLFGGRFLKCLLEPKMLVSSTIVIFSPRLDKSCSICQICWTISANLARQCQIVNAYASLEEYHFSIFRWLFQFWQILKSRKQDLQMCKYCNWANIANIQVLQICKYCKYASIANMQVLQICKYCKYASIANMQVLQYSSIATNQVLQICKYCTNFV